jgi:hypothetical protein
VKRSSVAALFCAAFVLALAGAGAQAADVPYTVQLNARGMMPSKTPSAIERNGVVFIDIGSATRIFDGLITYAGDSAHLTIGRTEGDFRLGKTTAMISGTKVTLPGAPFRAAGEFYVPMAVVVVRLGGARLHLDRQKHLAQILTGPRQSPPPAGPTPAPKVSLSSDGADLPPSLGQALQLVPSGSIDAAGLHVRVDIANETDQPVVATFASSAQIAFVVLRNGAEVWDSTAGKMFAQAETSLTFEPRSTRSFTDLWAGFTSAGAGRYSLRAKLLTAIPLVSSPVSLGVIAPLPSST